MSEKEVLMPATWGGGKLGCRGVWVILLVDGS